MPEGGSKETPPPLLVIPHGGPWVRDYWGFNPEAQFWASRGYAVIQPNYRGSTGYDWKFPIADRYDFLKMHDDVTRAAKTLILSGYADPDRVAIMGASFGGYLALSGVVHEPDLYKCALTFAGVFDFETVLNGARRNFQRARHGIFLRRLGDPKEQKEKYESISPIRHLDQVSAPVFVAHGKEDQTALVGGIEKTHSRVKRARYRT
jgi:dipeptidyl aminopeptidase/acylaminoacyl peptidase